jgi:predicted GNAT family N-acyltransferase
VCISNDVPVEFECHSIADYPTPLRATHNKKGERPPRPNHRLVPSSKFEEFATIEDVLIHLFGEFRYDVTTCVPADLSQSELGTCVTLVRDGGALEVDCETRLRRATHLAVGRRGDAIVAVGAIKEVRPDYAKKVSGRSEVRFPSETLELGYVAVDKDHRGQHLSDRIVARLLSTAGGPLFATTDDAFMKRTLKKAGFAEKGQSWEGQRGILSLWWRD